MTTALVSLALVTFLAASLLAIGLRVLLLQRALVLSSRWMLAFMVVGLAPSAARGLAIVWNAHLSDSARQTGLFSVCMDLLLLAFFWYVMSGWTFFGVSEDSFRNALHGAMKKLGLTFEEKLAQVVVPSENAVLQIMLQGRVGSATMRMKRGSHALGKRIVEAMRIEFATSSEPPNRVIAVIYTISGVFMMTAAGLLVWMALGLR